LLSAHALPSALAQEDVELEAIVVDDGSSDGTLERLGQLNDHRLRVLENARAAGVSGARNTGVDAAAGRWLAFLDDDDLWSPRKLRMQLAGMGSARWGYASVIIVDESLRALHLGNVVGGPSNVMAEATLVRELGGFDETLSHSADWDLWLRLVGAAMPAACSKVLVAAVRHSQRMLFRDNSDIGAETARVFAKHGVATRRNRLAVAEWLASEHRSGGNYLAAAGVYARAGVRYRSPGNVLAGAGALFGEPGLRAVSRLLLATRGATHLEPDRPPEVEPDWLVDIRSRLVAHA
jgi:glycosyltransferase involved in cell wall biosynthesis